MWATTTNKLQNQHFEHRNRHCKKLQLSPQRIHNYDPVLPEQWLSSGFVSEMWLNEPSQRADWQSVAKDNRRALGSTIIRVVSLHMNCPKCSTAVAEKATQCPACHTALQSVDPDATIASNIVPVARAAKAATAKDVAATVATPIPAQGGRGGAVTAPSFGTIPPRNSADISTVDFGTRYKVERLLGQGGMGAVYLAYDQDLGRQVALKLVRPELMVYPGAMDRFRQELLLASKISHRNILRIHDLGDAGGMKFISMAYVDGEDLHQLLVREGKLPLDRMLSTARQLCAALDAAHSEGVAHRDLKPQNVMMGKDDHVYVTDFGLAKSLGAADGMTQSGEMLGTPRYNQRDQNPSSRSHIQDHRAGTQFC